MPGERHPQELLHVFGGRVNTGPTATRKDGYVLGLPLCGHCIRLDCAPAVVSYRKHHHDFPYVYPPSRRVALARRAALAREPRAGETERARLHCPTRDPAATAGSRTSPRRLGHSTAPSASRRCSPRCPRCQTSCAPDGHAWGVGAPSGVPARGGCGGGLVGSHEDCALLASWRGRCGGRPPM